MNYELLKTKMDEFFKRVTADELVDKFKAMGYVFEDLKRGDLFTFNGIDCRIAEVQYETDLEADVVYIEPEDKNQDLGCGPGVWRGIVLKPGMNGIKFCKYKHFHFSYSMSY